MCVTVCTRVNVGKVCRRMEAYAPTAHPQNHAPTPETPAAGHSPLTAPTKAPRAPRHPGTARIPGKQVKNPHERDPRGGAETGRRGVLGGSRSSAAAKRPSQSLPPFPRWPTRAPSPRREMAAGPPGPFRDVTPGSAGRLKGPDSRRRQHRFTRAGASELQEGCAPKQLLGSYGGRGLNRRSPPDPGLVKYGAKERVGRGTMSFSGSHKTQMGLKAVTPQPARQVQRGAALAATQELERR